MYNVKEADIPAKAPNSLSLGGTIVPEVATPREMTAWAFAETPALRAALKAGRSPAAGHEIDWSKIGKSLETSIGGRLFVTSLSKLLNSKRYRRPISMNAMRVSEMDSYF